MMSFSFPGTGACAPAHSGHGTRLAPANAEPVSRVFPRKSRREMPCSDVICLTPTGEAAGLYATRPGKASRTVASAIGFRHREKHSHRFGDGADSRPPKTRLLSRRLVRARTAPALDLRQQLFDGVF